MSEFILNSNEAARTYLLHKPKSQIIDRFTDFLSFLNNDEPSWVYNENMLFPSVSVAFQAARAQDLSTKEKIQQVDSPEELVEIALTIEDPPDWENKRLKVMEILIRDKFLRSMELRERLRLTEDKQIVQRYEEESASNLFWGYVGSKGQNWIGRILEAVRKDISDKSDMKKWLLAKFPLENDPILLPTISLNVVKDGQAIEKIELRGRNHYYMGQYKTNSVLLAHPSISRLHACIVCEDNQKVRLIDLESKSGSFVNGEIIEKLQDREIKTGDILTFALSTRQYEVVVDYRQVDIELQKRYAARQAQVRQLQKLNQPSISVEELKRIMGFSLDDTLFVSGLPESASQLAVKALFEELAKVKSVKIPIDKKTGRARGFAYVVFETPDEFRKAHLKSMNIKFGEKKLNVKIADKEKSQMLMEICNIKEDKQDQKKDFLPKSREYGGKDREYKDSERRKRSRSREDTRRRSKDRENNRRRSNDREQKRKESEDRDQRRKRSRDRDQRRKRSEEREQRRKRSEDKEIRRKRSEDRESGRRRNEVKEIKRKKSEDREEKRKRSSDRDQTKKQDVSYVDGRDKGRLKPEEKDNHESKKDRQFKQDAEQDRDRDRKNNNKQENKYQNQRKRNSASSSSSRSASFNSSSSSLSASK